MVLSSKHVRMVGPVVVPQTRQLLVGLVADAAAEGLPSDVGHQVPLQHGGGAEDLPACGAGVVLLRVHLVDVLAVVLQRGEAHPALLAVVGIFYVWLQDSRRGRHHRHPSEGSGLYERCAGG